MTRATVRSPVVVHHGSCLPAGHYFVITDQLPDSAQLAGAGISIIQSCYCSFSRLGLEIVVVFS